MAAVSKRSWVHKGETKTAWIVRYRDAGGAHRQKTFERKKEADAYRLARETEAAAGTMTSQPDITWGKLAPLFSTHTSHRLSTGQIGQDRADTIEMVLRCFVLPYFGNMRIRETRALDVEQWVASTTLAGQPRNAGRRMAASTQTRNLNVMQMMEDYAVKHGYLARRFMAEARKEIGRPKTKPIRTFTAQEVQQLVDKLNERRSGQRERDQALLRCYVYLAAFCGLRVGEIHALTPSAIDLDRPAVQVRASMTPSGLRKGPKTAAGVRDVPLPGIVCDVLRDWLDEHWRPNDHGALFTTEAGQIPLRTLFSNRWEKLRKAAGLSGDRNLHFHALRHFYASSLIEHGVPLTDVPGLLGHSHFDQTLMTYAHPVRSVDAHLGRLNQMAGSLRLA